VVTPTARFYVRNHSPAPRLDPASWRLEVSGLVDRPLRLALRELHHMPAETLMATLADRGTAGDAADLIRFERSLPVADAGQSGALLAYAMNGEPLPPEHGHPMRLIVPGWYAVASVKWLTGIEVIGAPFTGFFQVKRYIYGTRRDGTVACEPVRLQHVRPVIT
jgi:DMSO/TMAO reductase YedYZ molybdopterin-dependent catalytic subunit